MLAVQTLWLGVIGIIFIPLMLRRFHKQRVNIYPSVAAFGVPFLMTVFGLIYYSNGGGMLWGLETNLTNETMKLVSALFIIEWSLLLIALSISPKAFFPRYAYSSESLSSSDKHTSRSVLTVLAAFITVSGWVLASEIPGLVAVANGGHEASLAKGRLTADGYQSGLFLIGYLARYLALTVFAVLIVSYADRQRGLTLSLGLLLVIDALFSFEKSALLRLFLISGVAVGLRGGIYINLRLLAGLFLVLMGTFFIFSFTSAQAGTLEIAERIARRVFFVQMEGAFLMLQAFPEQLNEALVYGFPGGRRFFGVSGVDPAAEIVKIYLGEVPGWVNMNTSFIAQSWVMLGPPAIVLAPAAIMANLFTLNQFHRIVSRLIGSEWSLGVLIVIWVNFPINTNFSLFLYGKLILHYVVMVVAVYFVKLICASPEARGR